MLWKENDVKKFWEACRDDVMAPAIWCFISERGAFA